MTPDALLDDLRARRIPAVARSISMVENGRPGFEELLAAVHPLLGHARRIGLTGPPGAGKSTLTEQLVRSLRARDLTVAIVAVDPTSPFTGGALLGDRIRMEDVALDPGVYIRSMATRGSLGGLAMSTREVCDVLDAAGFDYILVETVGVGQSELEIARTTDTTMLILVPESGDGIQVLKAGVIEAADIFVVNKADRPGADRLRQELSVMLGIRAGRAMRNVPAHHGAVKTVEARRQEGKGHQTDDGKWIPPVLGTVAVKGDGVDDLAEALDRHHAWLEASGELAVRRRARLHQRTREVVNRAVRQWVWTETRAESVVEEKMDAVAEGRLSPYEVASGLLENLKQGVRI